LSTTGAGRRCAKVRDWGWRVDSFLDVGTCVVVGLAMLGFGLVTLPWWAWEQIVKRRRRWR
jgi:hypothetical protein